MEAAKQVLEEGINGPNNLGSFHSATANAKIAKALATTYDVKFNLSTQDYADLRSKYITRLTAYVGSLSVTHPKLRTGQTWLLDEITTKIPDGSTVYIVGGGYRALRMLFKKKPANHMLVYDRRRPREVSKIAKDLLSATADFNAGKVLGISTEATVMLNNNAVGNGTHFAIADNVNGYPGGNYDTLLFVDSIYDYDVLDVKRLALRLGVKQTISIHHTCSELAKSKSEIPNPFFHTRFRREGKDIYMLFEDGSSSYKHDFKKFMYWSQSDPVQYTTTCHLETYIQHKYGYGAFQITFDNLQLWTMNQLFRNTQGEIVECICIVSLLKGKFKTFWCDREKLESAVNYLFTQTNEPIKLMQWIRSHLSKVVVGPKVLDEKWNLMDKTAVEVLYFVMTYASLIKLETGNILKEIGTIINNKGRMKTPFQMLVLRVKNWFSSVATFLGFRGKDLLELIRDMHSNSDFHAYETFRMRALAMLGKTPNDQMIAPSIPMVWWIWKGSGFPDGIGGVVSSGQLMIKEEFEKIKKCGTHLNNSAAKITEIIRTYKLNTNNVVNVASSPGGLNYELDGNVISYVYTGNEFPEFTDSKLYEGKINYKTMDDIMEVEVPKTCTLYISDAGVRAEFLAKNKEILSKNINIILKYRPPCAIIKFMNLMDHTIYDYDEHYMPCAFNEHFEQLINNYSIRPVRSHYSHKLSFEMYFVLKRRESPLITETHRKYCNTKVNKWITKYDVKRESSAFRHEAFSAMRDTIKPVLRSWNAFWFFYEAKKFELIEKNAINHNGAVKKKFVPKRIDPLWFFKGRISELHPAEKYVELPSVRIKKQTYISDVHKAMQREFENSLKMKEAVKHADDIGFAERVKIKAYETRHIKTIETIKNIDVYTYAAIKHPVEKETDSWFAAYPIRKSINAEYDADSEVYIWKKHSYFYDTTLLNTIELKTSAKVSVKEMSAKLLQSLVLAKVKKEDKPKKLRPRDKKKKKQSKSEMAPSSSTPPSDSSDDDDHGPSHDDIYVTHPELEPKNEEGRSEEFTPPDVPEEVLDNSGGEYEPADDKSTDGKEEIDTRSKRYAESNNLPDPSSSDSEIELTNNHLKLSPPVNVDSEVVKDVTDVSRHRPDVEIKMGPSFQAHSQGDAFANAELIKTAPIIRKTLVRKEMKQDADAFKFEPKKFSAVENFLKDNKEFRYCDVPDDGLCVYYSIAAIKFGMIEQYKQVQRIYAKKLKGDPDKEVPAANMIKLCNLMKVSWMIVDPAGQFQMGECHNSTGLLIAFQTEKYEHCGVLIVNKPYRWLTSYIQPHPYVRIPIDFKLPTERKYAYITDPLPKGEQSATRFEAFKTTVKSMCLDAFKDYVKLIKFTKKKCEWLFYTGVPGCGKSVAIINYLREHVLKVKSSGMKCSSKVFVITPIAANRGQIDAMLTKAANLSINASNYMPIKTHHQVFETLDVQNKEGFNPREAEVVIFDEVYKLTYEEMVVYHQMFPKAVFVCVGDPLQPGVTATEVAKRSGISDTKTLIDIFGIKFLTNKSSHVTVNNVSRRFGPAIVALNRTFDNKNVFYCDSFRPTNVTFNSAIASQVPGETIHIAMENATIESCGSDAMTIISAQGLSKDNIIFHMGPGTFANLQQNSPQRLVGLTRCKYTLIFRGDPAAVKMMQGRYNLACNNIVKTWKVGGLRVGNLKRVQAVDPDFDPDIARETALMGYPLPEGATPFKTERRVKYPFTTSSRSFSLPLFDSFCHENPFHYDNSKESMSFSPEWEYPMKIYRDKWRMYENDMVRLGYSFSGKQHFSASTVQEVATFMGRYEIALKRQKYQRKMLKGVDPWKLGHQAMLKFFMFYIDDQKYEDNLNRKVFDDTLLKSWNDYAVVAKFAKADAEMTMRQFKAVMHGHLKKQIKSKGFEKAMANDPGQPISAAEKAINLIFSCLFRFMSIMIKNSLKSNICVADGLSDREVWEFIKQFEPKRVFMGDYPKYDATQTKFSHVIEAATWMLVCPDPDLLKFYLDASRGRPIYTSNFTAMSAAQRDSGQVDTMCGNWLTSMIHMAFMIDDYERIVYAVFKGDDSGVGFKDDNFYLYGQFYKMFFPEPIKIVLHETVLEFCNYLFDRKAYVYNPHIFLMKLKNKNYNEVIKTRANWEEFMISLVDVLNSYLEHPNEAETLCSKWTGISSDYYNVLFEQLQAFAQIKHKHVKNQLNFVNVTVRDYGGLRKGHFKEPHPNQEEEIDYNTELLNMSGESIVIHSRNKVFTATEYDIKSKYNEAVQDGIMPVELNTTVTGPAHLQTFRTVAKRYEQVVQGDPRNSKDSAERSALLKFFQKIEGSNALPVKDVQNDLRKRAEELSKSDSPFVYYPIVCRTGIKINMEEPDLESILENLNYKDFGSYKELKECAVKMKQSSTCVSIKKFPANTNNERRVRLERCAWYAILEFAAKCEWVFTNDSFITCNSVSSWPRFLEMRTNLSNALGISDWIKDLTAEGIEPNPGPVDKATRNSNKAVVKREVKKEAKKEAKKEVKREHVNKGKQEVKKKKPNLKHADGIKRSMRLNPYQSRYRNNKIATAEQIAMTIACPEDTLPLRLHGTDGAAQTALNKLKIFGKVNMPTVDGTILANQWACFLFRDMLRSAIVYYQNASNWQYNCMFSFDYGANNTTNAVVNMSITLAASDLDVEFRPKILAYQVSGGVAPHGNYLFTGKPFDGEDQYVWLGKEDTMSIQVAAIPLGATVTFKTLLWANGKWAEKDSTAATAIAVYQIKTNTDAAGYYSWKMIPTVVVAGGFQFSAFINGNTNVWAHIATPFVFENLSAISGYRQNSKGLRIANTTAQIYNDVQMSAVQVPKGEFWTSFTNVANSGVDTMVQVSNASKSTDIVSGQKGYTGYLKPNEIVDFTFKTGVATTNGTIQSVYYILDANTDFLAFACTSANTSFINMKYNIFEHNEYKTMDTWRDSEPCLLKQGVVEEALDIVKFAVQHAENPTHWSSFWNSIKNTATKVAKGVVEYGPTILKFAEAFA